MRFRGKATEPGQMIALSRVAGAIHKLTKTIVLILRKDKVSFVMPTSVATFSNASATSRCLSSLVCDLEVQQMFSDYVIECMAPEDDGIYMSLDTEHLARAFTLKTSADRSLSFLIKLAKVGDKPCLLVRREQLSTSLPDVGADDGMAADASGVSSFFFDHKLGIEWVPRRHWQSYKDVPDYFVRNIPACGLAMPNDIRHIKLVIDRFNMLHSKDAKNPATVVIDPRNHKLGFSIDCLTFDAWAEFTELSVFNRADYEAPHTGMATPRNSEFRACIDLHRLSEALAALDKITQQSFVPASLGLLGTMDRRAIALVAVMDVGVRICASIGAMRHDDDDDDVDDSLADEAIDGSETSSNVGAHVVTKKRVASAPKLLRPVASDEEDTADDIDDNNAENDII